MARFGFLSNDSCFFMVQTKNHRVSPYLPDYPGLGGTSNFLSFADKSRSTLSVALKYLGAAVSWRSGESQAARPHIPPCSEKLCFRSNTPSCLVSKACCSKAAPPKKKGNTFVLLFMGVKGQKFHHFFQVPPKLDSEEVWTVSDLHPEG